MKLLIQTMHSGSGCDAYIYYTYHILDPVHRLQCIKREYDPDVYFNVDNIKDEALDISVYSNGKLIGDVTVQYNDPVTCDLPGTNILLYLFKTEEELIQYLEKRQDTESYGKVEWSEHTPKPVLLVQTPNERELYLEAHTGHIKSRATDVYRFKIDFADTNKALLSVFRHGEYQETVCLVSGENTNVVFGENGEYSITLFSDWVEAEKHKREIGQLKDPEELEVEWKKYVEDPDWAW